MLRVIGSNSAPGERKGKLVMKEITKIGDPQMLSMVDAILAAQDAGKPKAWGTVEHLSLLAGIAAEHGMPEASRLDFMASAQEHGIGGNASAFRQWLASPKGGKRLPEQSARTLALDRYLNL